MPTRPQSRRIAGTLGAILIATLFAWSASILPATPIASASQDSLPHIAARSVNAPAAARYVTNTNDSGVGSLRNVVASAGVGDTIGFTLTLPATIVLTSGVITLTDVTLDGPGANSLTISGNNSSRVFGAEGNVSITGITIRDGNAGGDSAGAIFINSGGALTLTSTSILSNTAALYGTIFNYGTLVISNTTITANSSGGAGSAIGNGGTLTILNSAIYSNTSTTNGPAIYSLYVSTVSTIVSSTIHYNTGGAISTNGLLTIISSTIANNVVPAASGFGAGINSDNFLTVTDSTISNNSISSNGSGSGIYATSGATMTLNNVTISNNRISGAIGSGGGIYFAGHVANLNNVTISENGAKFGGGVYVGVAAPFNFKNTIIAGNTAATGPDCYGTVNSQDYNLVGDSTACTIGGGPTHDQSGDPKLTPLAWLGGSTQTHGLLSGSPALNSGNPAVPGSGGDACIATDQRGTMRPVAGTCDIGAFEGTASALYLPLIMK